MQWLLDSIRTTVNVTGDSIGVAIIGHLAITKPGLEAAALGSLASGGGAGVGATAIGYNGAGGGAGAEQRVVSRPLHEQGMEGGCCRGGEGAVCTVAAEEVTEAAVVYKE